MVHILILLVTLFRPEHFHTRTYFTCDHFSSRTFITSNFISSGPLSH